MPLPPHSSSITELKTRSPCGLGADVRHDLGREQVCREAALHVPGAAAPDPPLGDLAAPGIVAPRRVRIDGHDIDMAAQVQRASAVPLRVAARPPSFDRSYERGG